MAVWKKVVVSGSSAELAALKVDNLNSGEVVIGGGNSANLSTRIISGSGAILASGGSNIVLSGSFSGSFFGNGANLTGVIAAPAYALTFGEGIGLNAQGSGSYTGNQPATITVSGAVDLTDGRHIRWDNNANKLTNSLIYDDGTNIQITGSTIIVSGASTAFIVTGSVRSFGGFTGSLFGTSSWATNATTATQVANALTPGSGLSGTVATYNGSAAVTFNVGAGALITANADDVQVATSSLSINQIPKFINNSLSGSNITDTGTQIQIGAAATSGLLINAGGITVTGNSTFNNNLSVTGNLTVAGTASFTNTDSLFVADKFIALASGSTTIADSGLIVVTSTSGGNMSGSALYLESTTDAAPNYGRWAVAANINATASAATADEWMVTAKISPSTTPSAAPTWGGQSQGVGNMWIKVDTGDIFIYV